MLVQLCLTDSRFSVMFHNAEMFQEVVGEGGSMFVFPRLIADIQKKGKPAFPNTHSGGLWVRDSSEEMHVCKSSAEIFLYCWLCAVQLLSVDATFASCMVIFFKMMIFFFLVVIYLKSVLLQGIEKNWWGRALNCWKNSGKTITSSVPYQFIVQDVI